MYVIQVRATNSSSSAITSASRSIGANSTETYILPADRCSWQIDQASSGSNYNITDVVFYSGNAAGETLVKTDLAIDARFGYIGKSGRFVEIAG